MSHYIQANTDGRLHPANEPSISPLNRGFLYGDAIYEVWRTYHRVIFAWEEHWRRLRRSAAALFMELPWDEEMLLREIRRTISAFESVSAYRGELYIRLQITRGAGSIGLNTALADAPTFTLMVQANPSPSESEFREGWSLSIVNTLKRNSPSTLNPAWKTGNYLNNILCLHEAKSRGANEAVILNLDDEITEASVCNLGFVRDGKFFTPPLSAGILAGITRGLVLSNVAALAGVEAQERTIRVVDLDGMEECCLLSTTKDVLAVNRIDNHVFRTGEGTVLARIKAAFADYAQTYSRQHPELAIG